MNRKDFNHKHSLNALLVAAFIVCAPCASRADTTMEFTTDGLVPETVSNFGHASTGDQIHDTYTTGESPYDEQIHRTQNPTQDRGLGDMLRLPKTNFTQEDQIFGHKKPQQLPQTRLDSFVSQAGGAAFFIYGDEGVDDKPPLDDFSYIDTGIQSGQLTTGHRDGSLPSAWGLPTHGKP